jgi:hypothetical protein
VVVPKGRGRLRSRSLRSDSQEKPTPDETGDRTKTDLEEIPNDSAAALILLEHHWAVPLRDAIARAGGFRISDGFISPLDLIEIGLVSADEAKELHEMETAGAAS